MDKYGKTIRTFDLKKWRKDNPSHNPNLNQVLGTNIELFNHAWFQLGDDYSLIGPEGLLICCEPWDRTLSEKEASKLFSLIRKHETTLLDMFGAEYLEIENYLGV